MLYEFILSIDKQYLCNNKDMKTKNVHIENPSKELLMLMKGLRKKKEEDKAILLANKDRYASTRTK